MRSLFQISMLPVPAGDPKNSRNSIFIMKFVRNMKQWSHKSNYQEQNNLLMHVNLKSFKIGGSNSTWRIMMTAKIRMDQATKMDVLISTEPSSVRTSLRTAQKPIHAPAKVTKARRKMVNCSIKNKDGMSIYFYDLRQH